MTSVPENPGKLQFTLGMQQEISATTYFHWCVFVETSTVC